MAGIQQIALTDLPYNPVAELGNDALWLRADLGVTTSGGEVTGWADKSGLGDSGRNFAPVTDRPAWNATAALYNNQPTIGTFNKVGAANNCKLKSGTWSSTYTNWTFIVFGHTTTGNRYFCYQSEQIYSSVANNSSQMYMYVGASQVGIAGGVGPTDTPKLIIAEFVPAAAKIFIDAVITPTVTGTQAASSVGSLPYTLGAYAGTNASDTYGVEAIAEVLVLNGTFSDLTTAQKIGFRNYINQRYAKSIST